MALLMRNSYKALFPNSFNMTFFSVKVIKGKEYIYLEKREWIGGRSKRTFQKYIGPRERFPDLVIGKRIKPATGDSL